MRSIERRSNPQGLCEHTDTHTSGEKKYILSLKTREGSAVVKILEDVFFILIDARREYEHTVHFMRLVLFSSNGRNTIVFNVKSIGARVQITHGFDAVRFGTIIFL